MRIKQISAFVENKIDQVSEITKILGKNNINIKYASIADAIEFGILRMLVDDADKAVTALESVGIAVKISDVVAVEMPDRPNGLNEILTVLSEANVNMEYMYAFVGRGERNALVVFKADNADVAEKALSESGITDVNARTVIDTL